MSTGQLVDSVESPSFGEGGQPVISVIIPTYQRRAYLDELFASLEAQTLPAELFEVIMVDDHSNDDSWPHLVQLIEQSSLGVMAARNDRNRGPAATRNAAVGLSRSALLAFTDDDCLPSPEWLAALIPPLEAGHRVVQGRVTPPPEDWEQAGPWDHTIWVRRPSPFFETCNVAYQRDAFISVGGFDDSDPLLTPEVGRGFGEDADLAARVLKDGGERGFAPHALVHHRVVPWTFRRFLTGQRHTAGFPGLARRSPYFSAWLKGGIFLSTRTATFDLAVIGLVVAAATSTPVSIMVALPWMWLRARDSARRSRRHLHRVPVVLAQHFVSDLVTMLSLLEGSVRHRRLIM